MEQAYMEILLEEMRSKFDLVLEGHASLNAKIDELRRESNEKHDLTAFKLEVMVGQVKSLDTRVETLEGRFDTLDGKVDAIAADLAAHRADTEAHARFIVRE